MHLNKNIDVASLAALAYSNWRNLNPEGEVVKPLWQDAGDEVQASYAGQVETHLGILQNGGLLQVAESPEAAIIIGTVLAYCVGYHDHKEAFNLTQNTAANNAAADAKASKSAKKAAVGAQNPGANSSGLGPDVGGATKDTSGGSTDTTDAPKAA